MSWNRYYGDEDCDGRDPNGGQARALRDLAKLEKKGEFVDPLKVKGNARKLCGTFYGQAWCTNLESYSDYSNRLPRGRTYLRKSNVRGLTIEPGNVFSYVLGAELYEVEISIDALPKEQWADLVANCAGEVSNLVDLLSGRLTPKVMKTLTDLDAGLFPKPTQVQFNCSCPDYATMCKHVAAVLYGVGVKLDSEPELLFVLRNVDHQELLGAAVARAGNIGTEKGREESAALLAAEDLSEIFGIEISEPEAAFYDLP